MFLIQTTWIEEHMMTVSLYYICSDESAHSFDFWKMEGGVLANHLTFRPFRKIDEPLGFWRKCEFLLESSDNRLILYDSTYITYKEIRDLRTTGLSFSIHILKESLITIKKEEM